MSFFFILRRISDAFTGGSVKLEGGADTFRESPLSVPSSVSVRVRVNDYMIKASTSGSSAIPKEKRLPAKLSNRDEVAYPLVPKAEEEFGGTLTFTSSTPKEKRLPAKFSDGARPSPSIIQKVEEEVGEAKVKAEVSTTVITPMHLVPASENKYPEITKPCNAFGKQLEDTHTTKFTYATCANLDSLKSLPLKSHQIEGFEFLRGLEDGGLTGGILADDMGLGKTLQIIALFLADMPFSDGEGYPSKSLVVVTPSLVMQWVTELKNFAPELIVYVHHGKTKIKDVNDPNLADVHVIITTYDQVMNEHGAFETVDKEKRSLSQTPLFTVHWKRVVLDEAHMIRNRKGKKSMACCALPKTFGHCVTGTPAQNTIDDLYPLLYFLRVKGLGDWNTFSALISEPAKSGSWFVAFSRLKATLNTHLVRRTKLTKHNGEYILKLGKRKDVYIRCQLTDKQMDGYHFIEDHYAAQAWTKYILYRLLCDHPILLRKFVDKLNNEGLDVAMMWLNEPLGKGDLLNSEAMYNLPDLCGRCNSKKRHLSGIASQIPEESLFVQASAKFMEAIGIVTTVLGNNKCISSSEEPDKILVVSSFVKTLDLFASVLVENGIKYSELNGKMSPSQRDQALSKIKQDREVVVFLLSLTAGGVGLNITSCNHLILLEPWWNPHAEDQVFGRIYRMGQKKDVFVYKLYCGDTVEEKILKVQLKKKELIRGAFLGSCEPEIDSNEPADADILLLRNELRSTLQE